MMKKTAPVLLCLLALVLAVTRPARAAAPDYSAWQSLLARYYDPARGMDYKGLKAKDTAALAALARRMAEVDPKALPRPDQLAYWINLYNISVVKTIVDSYPVESIRDLSTDPIVRLNVFKKETVPVKGGKTSLQAIEDVQIRAGFKDPRIHFAINCAAESCPPIRPEPYVGARIDQQLDDQTRRFLNGPYGVRLGRRGDTLVLHASKILDWFEEDFERWGGGPVAFVRKYLPPARQKQIDAAGKNVAIEHDDYSWKLNDASR